MAPVSAAIVVTARQRHGTYSVRRTLPLLLLSLTVASSALAQGDKATPKPTATSRKASSRTRLSAAETDAALDFARTHHVELAELLGQLRENSPAAFRRGIREIHRTVQRLERIQEKQPSRYVNELERWKITSRLQLVAARWAMSQDPELEATMRDLIRQRAEIHVLSMKEERTRITKRLSNLDSQISDATEGLDDYVAKALSKIKKQVAFNAKSRQANHNKTSPGQPGKKQNTDN